MSRKLRLLPQCDRVWVVLALELWWLGVWTRNNTSSDSTTRPPRMGNGTPGEALCNHRPSQFSRSKFETAQLLSQRPIRPANRNHDFHNRHSYQAPQRSRGTASFPPNPRQLRTKFKNKANLLELLGSHRHPRNHIWPDLPRQAPRRHVHETPCCFTFFVSCIWSGTSC